MLRVKRVMTLCSIREQIRGQVINMLCMMTYCTKGPIGWELLRVLWWRRVELGIWVDGDCSSRGRKSYSWGEDKLDVAFCYCSDFSGYMHILKLYWFINPVIIQTVPNCIVCGTKSQEMTRSIREPMQGLVINKWYITSRDPLVGDSIRLLRRI